ncbi:hypothetical protein E0M25_06075 [Bacillus mycoides]|uniref:hypothetical protein n=1 Tax=Bacillus mycoides TaxID=1405 RepID=UPI00103C8168|nr:hypothetical protein [Bacillus mycoides]QWG35044.1 hypothetical protein EXW30_19795 [Bacillus mycoides]TBX80195.1 hypothetical protein E0M25_06075 [Bacillus mycoides]
MKYIAALTILLGSFFCFHTFMYADTPIQVVQKEVKYIENDNTVLYSKLWVRSMQNAVLFHHSDNVRNQDTLRNVTSSSLVKAKHLPFKKASMYIPRLSQYVSKAGKENIQVHYIAVHYNVKKENAYQLNGMNYFLQVFMKERGEWKIAESVVAPTEQIVQNGDGFGMKEERVYGDRRENVK